LSYQLSALSLQPIPTLSTNKLKADG